MRHGGIQARKKRQHRAIASGGAPAATPAARKLG